jgi:type I restriction enzyme S subunit
MKKGQLSPRKLADVAFFQEGPGLRTHQFTSDGMKVINVSNILPDGSIELSNTDKHISLNEFETRYTHFAVDENDIVLASSGNSYGKVGRIRSDHLPLMMNTSVIRFHSADRSILNDDYLYAFLRSPDFHSQVNAFVIGGAQPNFGPSHLKQMTIPVPPLAVQERIANAVSAYDDLIENNRRRMALLEESARLLYQEWFVHLRFPGHEHVRVVNGVPEGWDAGIIQDFYKTASGGTPSRTVPEYFTGDIPWVKTQELPNGFILDTDEKITEDAVKYSSAKIFPNRTLLVALYGATVGEVGILSMEAATNQACCAVMPKDDRAHFVHSYLFFRENKSQLMALSAGAAQNNISQQIIREYKMVMPPKSLMSVFTGALEPAFGQSLNLARQNEKLRAARDLLLPRLMSGEVAV